MTISSQLGFDYLWVDRICIIQDDQEDRLSQITNMGDIYTSASLVLIAACGDNMDFGLPGVSRPRSNDQRHVDVAGLQVTNLIEDLWDDELAVWSTRGWTYQEAVLARRRLYFTNRRAYFECATSCCHEDAYNLETHLKEYQSHRFIKEEERSRFETFARHLEYYSSRSLSYQSDIHHAFAGITNLLYERNKEMIDGLPKVDFDRALRWWMFLGKRPLIRTRSHGVVCPTWSWSSAMGYSNDTNDRIRYQGTELYGSLALWYRMRPVSLPTGWEIEPINLHLRTEMDDDWEVCMAIACEEGCLRKMGWCWSSTADTFATIYANFTAHWPDYYAHCKDALRPPEPPEMPEWFETLIDLAENPRPGIIFALTHCTSLRLESTSRRSLYAISIYNHQGNFIGAICGDARHLEDELKCPDYNNETTYEFIALSVSGEILDSNSYFDMDEKSLQERNQYFDVEGQVLKSVPIVNLLMIERSEKYACRKQLAWVYLKQWGQLQREWKVVRLE